METSYILLHVLILAAVAAHSTEAISCHFGHGMCVKSCMDQNCVTGHCMNRDSICSCTGCGLEPVSQYKVDTEYNRRPEYEQGDGMLQVGNSFSISQRVSLDRLVLLLNDDNVNYRFRLLGFKILTLHERVYEGWDSNRNASSEQFGILRKYVATREEGLELLEELRDMFSGVISEETKELLEDFVESQSTTRPAAGGDRFKRWPNYGIGGGWYLDIIPPSINYYGNGWDFRAQPTYSFSDGSYGLSFRFRW